MNTFAIIGVGGKQLRVAEGDTVVTEKVSDQVGEKLTLQHVFLVSHGGTVKVGAPLVTGAHVEAEVLSTGRTDKVRVFKMKRRKRLRINRTHRQSFITLKILKIVA